MKFLEYKECIAISRDRSGRLSCVKIRSGRKARLIVTENCSVEIKEGFVNAMADLLARIRPEEYQLVVFASEMPGAVVSEFLIPQMSSSDITSAIEYELVRHLPVVLPETITGYRIIDDNVSGKMRIRTITAPLTKWEEQLNEIRNTGLKIDGIIHPFMAIDPLLGEQETVSLRKIEPEFQFSMNKDEGMRKISVPESVNDGESYQNACKQALLELFDLEKSSFSPEESIDDYLPALLVGAYALSYNFETDKQTMLQLPKGMYPERFRWLRILFFAQITIVGLLLLLLLGRGVYEGSKRLDAISAETSKIDKAILEMKKDAVANKKFNELIDKISEVEPELGSYEILPALHDLAKYIPADMWMTNFNFRKDTVEATLIAKPGTTSDMDLSKSSFFSKVEKQKRIMPDQSTSINLKMQYVSPEQRNKRNTE